MADLISRHAAIEAITKINYISGTGVKTPVIAKCNAVMAIEGLPSAEPKKLTEMIKEIRRLINSGNRGNADYFIVDMIEEIINKYEE